MSLSIDEFEHSDNDYDDRHQNEVSSAWSRTEKLQGNIACTFKFLSRDQTIKDIRSKFPHTKNTTNARRINTPTISEAHYKRSFSENLKKALKVYNRELIQFPNRRISTGADSFLLSILDQTRGPGQTNGN